MNSSCTICGGSGFERFPGPEGRGVVQKPCSACGGRGAEPAGPSKGLLGGGGLVAMAILWVILRATSTPNEKPATPPLATPPIAMPQIPKEQFARLFEPKIEDPSVVEARRQKQLTIERQQDAAAWAAIVGLGSSPDPALVIAGRRNAEFPLPSLSFAQVETVATRLETRARLISDLTTRFILDPREYCCETIGTIGNANPASGMGPLFAASPWLDPEELQAARVAREALANLQFNVRELEAVMNCNRPAAGNSAAAIHHAEIVRRLAKIEKMAAGRN